MKSYRIMTISIPNLLLHTKDELLSRDACDDTGECPLTFDIGNIFTKDILLNTVSHASNALFDQILSALRRKKCGDTDHKIPQPQEAGSLNKDSDALFKSILIADFGNLFKRKQNPDEELLEKLFETGLSIHFPDGTRHTFLPFDKSGNMSRASRMTFLDADLFDEIDESVRLGIPFSNPDWQINLSKYYSYRGLYLTDGIRISGLTLNAETVLILPDAVFKLPEQAFLTAKAEDCTRESAASNEYEIVPEIQSVSVEKLVFDGEGLICPEYAALLNAEMSSHISMQSEAHSFQIRMPYIKGMLHEVDFHTFCKEFFQKTNGISNGRDDTVYDTFNIPRKLSDVRIILSASMFKCGRWLMSYLSKNPGLSDTDPAAFYFSRFEQYGHALYVCNTDANMRHIRVPLNYQFLNTMAIKGSELVQLVNKHIHYARSLVSVPEKRGMSAGRYLAEILYPETDNDFDGNEESGFTPLPSWRLALGANPAFLQNPYIKKKLEREKDSLLRDICSGRILVRGSLKYLSGDLLAFLCYLLERTRKPAIHPAGSAVPDQKDPVEIELDRRLAKLKRSALHSDRFYTPQHEGLQLKSGKRCAILRNPHLSRSEQCALRAYAPDEADTGNLYNKYFSHLENVLMLPYASADAMALGGADYDGDTVKLITDETITHAVLRGSYILSRNEKYFRRYPVICIPSLSSSDKCVPPRISLEFIKETFSGRIGQISNQANRKGQDGYSVINQSVFTADSRNSPYTEGILDNKDPCAIYTLATGLEIDAVKTGLRPRLDEMLADIFSPQGNRSQSKTADYINQMKTICDMEPYKLKQCRKQWSSGQDDTLPVFIIKDPKQTEIRCPVFAPDDNRIPPVSRLPGLCLQAFYDEAGHKETAEQSAGSKEPRNLFLFKFQTLPGSEVYDPGWQKELEEDSAAQKRMASLKKLISAYRSIQKQTASLRSKQKQAEKTDYMPKLYSALRTAYDFACENLPSSDSAPEETIRIILMDLQKIIHSHTEADEAVKKMCRQKWVLADESERPGLLMKILSAEETSLRDETKALLLNHHTDGFNYLCFFLKQIRAIYGRVPQFELEEKPTKTKNPYYRQFRDLYRKSEITGDSRQAWNRQAVSLCRNLLRELFRDNMQEALRYYYAIHDKNTDSGTDFLWEIFTTREILNAVLPVSLTDVQTETDGTEPDTEDTSSAE